MFRAAAIIIELLVLSGMTLALSTAAKLVVFDLGLDSKYQRFIHVVWVVVNGLALVFLISHLVTFYPRISP